MLKTLFNLSGIDIDDDVAEYIALSTSDHPYHMQLFGYILTNIGEVKPETLEIARREVQKILYEYYEWKILELQKMGKKFLDVLNKLIWSERIDDFREEELEIAMKLEKAGYIYRENNRFEFYDLMFKKFLASYLSNRPREKYLPEFLSEYIVAKEIAHREGFREVFVSYMSWGPFDLLIPKKVGEFDFIGIQVKRIYQETKIDKRVLEDLSKRGFEKKILPILAIVKLPEKKVRYYALLEDIFESDSLKKLLELF